MSTIAFTKRLRIRNANFDDAEFILKLINEPGWRRFINNHDIRTVDAAKKYIENKIIKMYEDHGIGLWVMELKDEMLPIGVCGLLKRDFLNDVDLGFALLEEYWGHGYVSEASIATINFAVDNLNYKNIMAFTDPKNERSVRVLKSLGFEYNGIHAPPGEGQSNLYSLQLDKKCQNGAQKARV